ncbi:MAG: Gfo/Idh/MocA family oxidoreductase [Clostridiales bacterium]|jgi:predicted dehydrogenase|nr:Gfo/Idh/MocA family oxidoreductase [Clostridiales bacterium]
MKDGKLQVALVGCGGIARQKHLPALSKLSGKCELAAFCDIIEERAANAAREFGAAGAKVCTDYKEVLKDGRIDVVHVLTPNVAHAPITVAAFEAGKHVLCEKPMAHNTEDAQKMLDAWKKSGKQFTIGYQNRFRPEIRMLRAAVEAGELGRIYFGKAHAVRRRAVPTWGVFPNKALQGGGPLIDIGTHALDITLWMMDNYSPQSVSGSVFYELGHLRQATEGNLFGPWDPETYEVEDSAFGLIKLAGGAARGPAIFLEASWALNVAQSREASVTLCGTLAGAEVYSGMKAGSNEIVINRGHHGQLTEERISDSGEIAYFAGGAEEPGTMEARQWLDAVLNGGSPLVTPEQAFTVTKILEALYKSAESGKEVVF